jgi:FKBP-type peptidyl-prolyl cis-trans isomerase
VVTPTGLRYVDQKIGDGAEAGPGKTVEVLYTGWLEDGTKFDSSLDPNHPFTFRIGIDEVIQGWHEGITGMKAGGRRRLVVPPELGYGKQGAGGGVIPGNATLVFEVELIAVR